VYIITKLSQSRRDPVVRGVVRWILISGSVRQDLVIRRKSSLPDRAAFCHRMFIHQSCHSGLLLRWLQGDYKREPLREKKDTKWRQRCQVFLLFFVIVWTFAGSREESVLFNKSSL
jgi:hypothetical protein